MHESWISYIHQTITLYEQLFKDETAKKNETSRYLYAAHNSLIRSPKLPQFSYLSWSNTLIFYLGSGTIRSLIVATGRCALSIDTPLTILNSAAGDISMLPPHAAEINVSG